MSSIDVRAIDEKDLRKQPAPATKQEFRVFLSEQAFDRAVLRGDGDTTREIGGVLVGEILRDDAGPYLKIDSTVDALHAEEKGAELTFTHATWEHIHKEMDGKHKDKKIVGWYHTHPGFGIFLSDRDQFIQKSFFNLPFQVAFVYDPKSREHGLFTWRDNEVVRARRYWIGAREQVWDGSRTPPGASGGSDKGAKASRKLAVADIEEAAAKAAPASDSLTSLTGSFGTLIAGGVFALLLGGFLGHWIGVGSANQMLVEAQNELNKAKLEGMQAMQQTLQSDLVSVLRDTANDEAMHKPIALAVAELDRVLALLSPHAPPAPDSAPAPGAGGGSASAPGAGSTAPAAVAPGAGSGSAAAAPGAGSASVAAAGANAVPAAGKSIPGSDDARLAGLATQLWIARDLLARLGHDRSAAAVTLNQLERATRRSGELRTDLARDVSEQRSGLGGLYAELASDALKTGDAARAKRLLGLAAHLDPGNRTRYEKLLQSFDKAASLPRETSDTTGSAGQGPQR
jgi:proteasome lid subunit RPN8/RPN11